MLEKRTYTRQELIEIYRTDRLDAIKRKIKKKGYNYIDCGRGNNYTMQIISLPEISELDEYCINTLGFSPQTDFSKLKAFLYFLINEPNFVELQYNEMEEILKSNGINISAATISNYYNKLMECRVIGFAYADEYIYYVYDSNIQHNRYISKKEYKKMYAEYWRIYRRTVSYRAAERWICHYYGNKPKKRPMRELNGIYSSPIKKLLDKENKKND